MVSKSLGMFAIGLLILTLCSGKTWAQKTSTEATAADLQFQIEVLQRQLDQMRQELNALREEKGTNVVPIGEAAGSTVVSDRLTSGSEGERDGANSSSIESLTQGLDLLNQKIDDEYQMKVESASRYRVRLSGMFLFNLFANRGVVDNIENPVMPIEQPAESNGNFGGTIRQTQLGLEVIGPDFLGARTSGNIQMDFAGGFSDTAGGFTIGLPRLRTGTARLDWKRTSVVAGQDGLFFSPLQPTSFASVEQPALSESGNLWAWVPQVRVEHRFASFSGSQITVTSGILDPVSGETPADGNNRDLGVGEASLEPAIATHLSWSKHVFDKPLTIGVGAYRARQYWQPSGPGTRTTSWLVSEDWDIPLTRWTSISGSFYRGKSLGAFGGGVGQSVILLGNPEAINGTNGTFIGLDSMGGWAQLKITPVQRIEFNTAFGQDNPFAAETRSQDGISYAGAPLVRNRTIFSNMIYRPRSNLLFSLEFRHLRGAQRIDGSSQSANHINLGMGILF